MIDRATMVAICAAEGISVAATPKVKTIAIPDPAAGAELSYTVPSGVVLLVLSFYARFTADVTAVNREPALALSDGTRTLSINQADRSVGASTGIILSWADSIESDSNPPVSGRVRVALQTALLLPGWAIGTETTNLQAGDQWSNVTIYCIEWS